MRVALIDFGFFEYSICLANALVKQAYVSLLVPRQFEPTADALTRGVELCYVDKPRMRSPSNLRMLAQIRRTLARLHPDVVHLLAVNPWVNVALLAWRLPPLVITVHDPVMHAGDRSQRNIPQIVRDLPLRHARGLITHGEALKEILLERHELSPEKIATMPIGELSIYRQWNDERWAEREGTVLFFGRIWPYKGLDNLIAAEPAISSACPKLRIVIAGRGEDFERYRRMMVHPERFEVLNEYVPREDVARLFQQASLVVLPYTEATQSAVIPLSFAFGKPVVASAVGGIPEAVAHGKDGLLVPPCDSGALAKAVSSLLLDPMRRRQMGQHALEKTKSELSWATIARRTMEIYREAIHG